MSNAYKCQNCGRYVRTKGDKPIAPCKGCGANDFQKLIPIAGKKDVDWELRRYEIAKDAMNAMLANPSLLEVVTNAEYVVGASCQERVAKLSVAYADALIVELKKD